MEVVRTYLEMRSANELEPVPLSGEGLRLERVTSCPVSFHRYLYREVGRNYHWHDRLNWTDEAVRRYLDDPRVSLFVLYSNGAPAGYFELRYADDRAVEIAYFGLLPEFIGQGLGKMLLSAAAEAAWAGGANRVWLHTCTLDDPAALPNYIKRGFRPFREERYIVELSNGDSDQG
jgi:ribosomal protein S18 acetylase RimI-like enzyme